MDIIPTLFAFLSLCFILLSLPPPSLSAKCNPEDKKVLKQIEKALTIPPHFETWTTDTGCCGWNGVGCDPVTHRVTDLRIEDFSVVSGRIPDAIGDLPALKSLMIQQCRNLTGPLPKSLTKLTNLSTLYFSSNGLSGPIPSFLSQLKNLDFIALSENSFSGPMPSFFSQLPLLTVLRLDGNKLTGSVPESLGKLVLPSSIFLGNNQLTGKVPKSLGNANFRYLDFSNNKLAGDISFLFEKKKMLEFAFFSKNLFKFNMSNVEFPEKLESLDLSHNQIYGSIPEQMTKLHISNLDFSYNRLCGKIPTGGRLQIYYQTAYFHNRCLCGAPLPACK